MKLSEKAYKLVKKIPKGKVTSYGIIARKLNTSARAVGQIMKRNIYKDVPCHRVIMSNGSIGGFKGNHQKEKINLLKREGIKIEKGKISKRFFYYFNS
ncbi:MAG: MGMT family protein [Candidatus Pacearchaeota archaeon]